MSRVADGREVPGRVLVAGASGVVGTAAVERFLADGWEVVAVSRRRPEVDATGEFAHVAVDLADAASCREALGGMGAVTHVVYAAVSESPGLTPGWYDPAQMRRNETMLANLLNALRAARAPLRHLSLLQGTKAYGAHHHPIPVPARESAPRDPHANFYWLHEDLVRERSATDGWAFTILRPQLIVGPNHGVVMNLPPVVGAYAAIQQELGLPFAFPGGVPYVWEAADARLVAGALAWAAMSTRAAGETYNVTNGEVFEWRSLWPALADVLGVDVGADEPLRLADYLPAHAAEWDRAVARHGLRPIALADLLGESHHYADVCFAVGETQPRSPTFLSTVKIRDHGFTAAQDTGETFRWALQTLIRRRIIPGPS